ncbi:MAG: HAMP domain-containing histidine kinase [Prevotella sp.]|nr:HAMP domain-containing histidine kinase [Prevotella sp.]
MILHIGILLGSNHLLAYAAAGLLIAFLILLFYNRHYLSREEEINNENRTSMARLSIIMQVGRLKIWTYDTDTRHYSLLSADGVFRQEYNPIDFVQFYNRDDFETLRSAVYGIYEGKRNSATLKLRTNPSNGAIRYFKLYLSIAEKKPDGRVSKLLGIQQDISEEHNKKALANEMLIRYQTIFNSSLIDMLYYDKDGVLTDINETACQSFNIPDRQKLLDSKYTFADNPMFKDVNMDKEDYIRTTTLIDLHQYQESHQQVMPLKLPGKVYYEAVIVTNRQQEGTRKDIYIAGRNVTEMVESFHQQQEGVKRLKIATQHIQEYIDNINYALRITNVRIVNYYPQSHTLEISTIIGKSQKIQLSQLRCIRLATPRYRRAVSSILNRMDHLKQRSIEQIIEVDIHDKQGRLVSLMFNLVPIFNEAGKVERYFGMCRNMTDYIETEHHLAIETQKAQETELLKESFLTNMSYEIRTPLNSVLGFAELFETDHDEEDETFFVEEIKKNTKTLLELINDILYLSRLDADMVKFKEEEFDFAELFDAYCQMGWTSVRPEVKTSIDNPYEHLVIKGDSENLGKAIQKLCVNSAVFTYQGMIRAKYEYLRNELAISIEDTGIGVDEETLPKVFERFVRNKDEKLCGTGLDLPIIKSIIEKMGGSIEMHSEQGKGTSVWIFLPCEATDIKKRDIAI